MNTIKKAGLERDDKDSSDSDSSLSDDSSSEITEQSPWAPSPKHGRKKPSLHNMVKSNFKGGKGQARPRVNFEADRHNA